MGKGSERRVIDQNDVLNSPRSPLVAEGIGITSTLVRRRWTKLGGRHGSTVRAGEATSLADGASSLPDAADTAGGAATAAPAATAGTVAADVPVVAATTGVTAVVGGAGALGSGTAIDGIAPGAEGEAAATTDGGLGAGGSLEGVSWLSAPCPTVRIATKAASTTSAPATRAKKSRRGSGVSDRLRPVMCVGASAAPDARSRARCWCADSGIARSVGGRSMRTVDVWIRGLLARRSECSAWYAADASPSVCGVVLVRSGWALAIPARSSSTESFFSCPGVKSSAEIGSELGDEDAGPGTTTPIVWGARTRIGAGGPTPGSV